MFPDQLVYMTISRSKIEHIDWLWLTILEAAFERLEDQIFTNKDCTGNSEAHDPYHPYHPYHPYLNLDSCRFSHLVF